MSTSSLKCSSVVSEYRYTNNNLGNNLQNSMTMMNKLNLND
jgi:hypothetical protein